MNDVTEPGAAVAQAQTEAQIAQDSQAWLGERCRAPGPSGVYERSGAHPHQPKGIPIGEVALFNRHKGAGSAVLIAQRVTAQSAVAAQQNLIFEVEVTARRRVDPGIEEKLRRLLQEVMKAPRDDGVFKCAVLQAAIEYPRDHQRVIVLGGPADLCWWPRK